MLERWRERDVFHESIRRREGAEPFIFYEGPPTANGRPGAHHVLARVFKDVFPRYQTMRGHYVPRKAGWDCHGLPVELEVEKELGFEHKNDIEAYGVDKFNAKCRESVLRYIDEWDELTERIGFWIDTGDAYFTLANEYVESVWWSLKTVWEKGLLTEGYKVVPYCTRCGTALSSHELALGYKDRVDPSVYVRFPLKDDPGTAFLGWTTTPWTLLSNAALAVNADVTYAYVRVGDEVLVVAEPLVERVLGEGAEVTRTVSGADLEGTRYEPPFPYIADYGPKGHTVLPADFVTTEDGTGVVHTGDRVRRGRLPARRGVRDQRSRTRCARTAPSTSASRSSPGGTSTRRPPTSSPRSNSAAGCSAPRSTSTPTRTAGAATPRSSTTPRRAGTPARPR